MPGRPAQAIEPAPGDAPSVRWEAPVTVRRDNEGYDFTGPYVGGDRTDRNIGLACGDVPGDGTLRLFRGAKLRLVDVDPSLIEDALRPGARPVPRMVRRVTDHNRRRKTQILRKSDADHGGPANRETGGRGPGRRETGREGGGSG